MRRASALAVLLLACADEPAPIVPEAPTLVSCGDRPCGAPCGTGSECSFAGICAPGPANCTAPPIESTDGWDDPPGTGLTFVIDELAVAARGRGFDVDRRCAPHCADNGLYQLGQLGNDQIRQALLGAEALLVIEIAGVDDPSFDESVTVKLYEAFDADDPFFPANNFSIPTGETKCCEFMIDERSTAGGQATRRIPARIAGGVLRATSPVTFAAPLEIHTATTSPFAGFVQLLIPEDRVEVALFLPRDLGEIKDGLLGGAVRLRTLSLYANPWCETLNELCDRTDRGQSFADLLALSVGIDMDLDGDGLESAIGDARGRITRCFDGCGDASCELAPIDPNNLESCMLHAGFQDGYSVANTFSGVRATILGVGRAPPRED